MEYQKLSERFNDRVYFEKNLVSYLWKFSDKKDIEVLSVMLAQINIGLKDKIIEAGKSLLEMLSNEPYDYIALRRFEALKGDDSQYYYQYTKNDFYSLCDRLYDIYESFGSLSGALKFQMRTSSNHVEAFCQLFDGIKGFYSNYKKSYCFRVNLMFCWLVSKDNVNMGIWDFIDEKDLFMPIDSEIEKEARELGMITYKSECFSAVKEFTNNCAKIAVDTPTRLYFAFYGFTLTKYHEEDLSALEAKKEANKKKEIIDAKPIASNKHIENSVKLKEFVKEHVPNPKGRLHYQMNEQAAKIKAYDNLCKNHTSVIAYHTFGSLISIEVLKKAIDMFLPTIKCDGNIYKQEVKQRCNKVMQEWEKYYNIILRTLYDNDVEDIRYIVQDLDFDIQKMFYSIKNHIDKYKERYSSSLSIIMVCSGLCDLVSSMFDERLRQLRRYEKNASISDFMYPKGVRKQLSDILDAVNKYNMNNLIIDLNKDDVVMLAVRVIDMKINSKERIKKAISYVEERRKERMNLKTAK